MNENTNRGTLTDATPTNKPLKEYKPQALELAHMKLTIVRDLDFNTVAVDALWGTFLPP